MRRLVMLLVVFAVVGSAPAWAGGTNACKLITAADAKKAVGVALEASAPRTVGLYQSCTYTSAKVTLIVLDRKLSRAGFDMSSKRNPGPVAHVAGVGSDAYSVQGGKGLLMWKNGLSVSLLVVGGGNVLKAEMALGKAVAAKL
ncbi:MAG: hypothetical protein ABI317_10820 [Gaiellales bacterium]